LLITAIFTGCAALFVLHDVPFLQYVSYLAILQHVIWLVIFGLNKRMTADEPMIMVYLGYILVILYPFASIYWNANNPVALFWFVLVIIGAVIFQIRHQLVFFLLTLAMVIFVMFSSHYFPEIHISEELLHLSNMITIISVVLLATFFALVYGKLRDVIKAVRTMEENRERETETVEETEPETIQPIESEECPETLERDRRLYLDICNALETRKLFKAPNCNARMVASTLNTNVTYISQAIATSDNGNFSALLNRFRISHAKSLLEDREIMSRYSIDYVCNEIGYKHRSTFNNAFKMLVGMTPSEYLVQQKLQWKK
jgi:AraC-like DNA-binding protein